MASRCSLVALLLPLSLVAAACSGGGGATAPTAPGAPSPQQVALDSYGLVNVARSDHGVEPPLALREAIARVAREHSEAMRDQGFFGHEDAQGDRVGERLTAAGITYRVAAENLAMVTNSANPAAWAHEQLMTSPDHRPNILDPSVQLIGVGVAQADSTYWITQIFVGR